MKQKLFFIKLNFLVLGLMFAGCGTLDMSKKHDDLISLYSASRAAKDEGDIATSEIIKLKLANLGKDSFEQVEKVDEKSEKIFLYYIAATSARIALSMKDVKKYSEPGKKLCNQKGVYETEPAKCTLIVTAPLFAAADITGQSLDKMTLSDDASYAKLEKIMNYLKFSLEGGLEYGAKVNKLEFLSPQFKELYGERINSVYCLYTDGSAEYDVKRRDAEFAKAARILGRDFATKMSDLTYPTDC